MQESNSDNSSVLYLPITNIYSNVNVFCYFITINNKQFFIHSTALLFSGFAMFCLNHLEVKHQEIFTR